MHKNSTCTQNPNQMIGIGVAVGNLLHTTKRIKRYQQGVMRRNISIILVMYELIAIAANIHQRVTCFTFWAFIVCGTIFRCHLENVLSKCDKYKNFIIPHFEFKPARMTHPCMCMNSTSAYAIDFLFLGCMGTRKISR